MSKAEKALALAKSLVDDGIDFAKRSIGNNPGAKASVLKRLGLRADAGTDAIVRAMKDNPMSTALVLWELGEAGKPLLDQLVELNDTVADTIARLGNRPDTITGETSILDLNKFQDEIRDLRSAYRMVGGRENFLVLRRALAISEPVVILEAQMTKMV